MAKRDASGAVDVTQGIIWQELLQLCLPIFFSSFFQQAYALINTFVVGRFAGKAALGGIQATMGLMELAIGFCVGVGSGCAVISGQFFGAHDDERLSRSVHTAIALALIAGMVCSVGGLVLIEPTLRLMGTPEELMGEALAYGRCYFGAMVFSLLLNMGSALLRSVGDSRSPSFIVAISCVINVILDLILVAGLHMEALGCGIATAISIACGALMIMWKLMHVDGAWRVHLGSIAIDRTICRRMLVTGIPLGVQSSVYSVSNLIAQSAINSFGTDAVAAWGLSGRIDGIVWMVSEALGIAVTTFSAQNFGARNYDRMRRSLLESLAITALLIGGLSAMLLTFVNPISRFFIDDESVCSVTSTVVHFLAPFYVCFSLGSNISGSIRGSGESFRPMLITIVGTCVFRVIWLLAVVPSNHTIEMVLLSYPVTWILTDVLFVVYYRKGHWLSHGREKEAATLSS